MNNLLTIGLASFLGFACMHNANSEIKANSTSAAKNDSGNSDFVAVRVRLNTRDPVVELMSSKIAVEKLVCGEVNHVGYHNESRICVSSAENPHRAARVIFYTHSDRFMLNVKFGFEPSFDLNCKSDLASGWVCPLSKSEVDSVRILSESNNVQLMAGNAVADSLPCNEDKGIISCQISEQGNVTSTSDERARAKSNAVRFQYVSGSRTAMVKFGYAPPLILNCNGAKGRSCPLSGVLTGATPKDDTFTVDTIALAGGAVSLLSNNREIEKITCAKTRIWINQRTLITAACRSDILLPARNPTKEQLDRAVARTTRIDFYPPLRPGDEMRLNVKFGYGPSRDLECVTKGSRYLCSVN